MCGAEIFSNVFGITIGQDYQFHFKHNSSHLITILTEKVGAASSLILSALTLINTSCMFLFIWGGLFLVDKKVTIISTVFFVIAYGGTIYFTRITIDKNSQYINQNSPLFLQYMRESYGSIREIILSSLHAQCIAKLTLISNKLRELAAQNIVMSQSPRYFVESIAYVMFGLVVLYIHQYGRHDVNTIALFGALALGFQRMLPLVQQIYSSLVNIKISKHSVKELGHFIKKYKIVPTAEQCYIDFRNAVTFNAVTFSYVPGKEVIRDASFTIPKGSTISIVGKSGSGKSTTLDLLSGLVEPVGGNIFIDQTMLTKKNVNSWRQKIAYVSQTIFLADDTVDNNIILTDKILGVDHKRLADAKRCAKVDFIKDSELSSNIGESGQLLSGGQRQRIGIARALYKRPEVLILDESTNAIDRSTEKLIFDLIKTTYSDLTIILVTHKEPSITCDYTLSITGSQLDLKKTGN
jgi:ATP-binding cassette subfamily B protein